MNKNMILARDILIILVVFIVLTVVAYGTGNVFAKSFLNGSRGVTHSAWLRYYAEMLKILGPINCLSFCTWYALAGFVLKIEKVDYISRRYVWGMVGSIGTVLCMATPYIYSLINNRFVMDIRLALLLSLLYGIGYWVLSVFITPASYKYTPLGAEMVFELIRK